jgi:hypothetical protein
MTRKILMAAGLLVALMGVIWMGQGSGYFPYPERSFMINDRSWIWWGGGMILAGLGLFAFARRM